LLAREGFPDVPELLQAVRLFFESLRDALPQKFGVDCVENYKVSQQELLILICREAATRRTQLVVIEIPDQNLSQLNEAVNWLRLSPRSQSLLVLFRLSVEVVYRILELVR
jgi:hypothetical protein